MALPALPPIGIKQARIATWLAAFWSCWYLLLGIIGILTTGADYFSNVTGVRVFGFSMNPLVSVIYLCVGLIGIPAATSPIWARRFLLILGGLGLPFAIVGFALDGSMSDYFATNTQSNAVHLLTAVSSLVVALWPAREADASDAVRPANAPY
jgi:hypothetical protein